MTTTAAPVAQAARRGRAAGAVARAGAERAAAVTAPVVARVRRWVSPVTGFGWMVAGALAAAVAAVTAWGWWEVSTIAWVLGAVIVLSVPFLAGRIAHTASLDLSRSRVVVGEPAFGAVTLTNETSRPLLPVAVDLPVGTAVATFAVPRLGAGESHEEIFTIPTHRRAVLRVGPVTGMRGDPLGLLARTVTWTEPENLYVHPRTVPLDGSSSGILQDLEGLPTPNLSNSDVAFHALREYVPGDDRRHVHWRSSARTGTLMVRQFEETRRSHLALALTLRQDEHDGEEGLELAISVVGSMGTQALKEGKNVSALVQGGRVNTRAGKPFLDALSGLTPVQPRAGSLGDVALAVGQEVPDASVAVLVCGSPVTPTALRRAASHIPSGVFVVAILAVPGAAVSRRTIGDIVVLTIGALNELPHVLRRVAA